MIPRCLFVICTVLLLGCEGEPTHEDKSSPSLTIRDIYKVVDIAEYDPVVVVTIDYDGEVEASQVNHSGNVIEKNKPVETIPSENGYDIHLPIIQSQSSTAHSLSDGISIDLCNDESCVTFNFKLIIEYKKVEEEQSSNQSDTAELNLGQYQEKDFIGVADPKIVSIDFEYDETDSFNVFALGDVIDIKNVDFYSGSVSILYDNVEFEVGSTIEHPVFIEKCNQANECQTYSFSLLLESVSPKIQIADEKALKMFKSSSENLAFNLDNAQAYRHLEYVLTEEGETTPDILVNELLKDGGAIELQTTISSQNWPDDLESRWIRLDWSFCDDSGCEKRTETYVVSLVDDTYEPPNEINNEIEPNQELLSLPDNTPVWVDYFTCPDQDDPDDAGRCKLSYEYNSIKYNPHTGKAILFGGGGSWSSQNDVLQFDFKELVWSSTYQRTRCREMLLENLNVESNSWLDSGLPLARYVNDSANIGSDSNEYVLLSARTGSQKCTESTLPGFSTSDSVSIFNFATGNWQHKLIEEGWQGYEATEVDPISGHILVINQYNYWIFDYKNGVEISKHDVTQNGLHYNRSLVYFPPLDLFYYVKSPQQIFEVKLDRKLWQVSFNLIDNITGDIPLGDPRSIVYDQKNQVFGSFIDNGVFHTFDPRENSWEATFVPSASDTIDLRPTKVAYFNLTYDPVNNVYFYISDKTGETDAPSVWIYKYKD